MLATLTLGSCGGNFTSDVPLIINNDDPGAAQVREAAERSDATQVVQFQASGRTVWALPENQVASFSARSAGFRASSFELLPAEAPSLLPDDSLTVDSLTDLQRASIAPIIAGLAPDAYRITIGRPADVGEYFLGLAGNAVALGSATWRTPLGSRLSLRLLDERQIVMAPTGIEQRSADDATWRGAVEGGGKVTLTLHRGGITGTIVMPDATYSIRTTRTNLQIIHRQQPDPPDHPPAALEAPEAPAAPAGARGRGGAAAMETGPELTVLSSPPPPATCAVDQAETIDALFAVTPAVALTVTEGDLKHAVDLANDVFFYSGLSGRMNYVAMEPIAYLERDLVSDFHALKGSAVLRKYRDSHRADVVAVVVQGPQAASLYSCGYSGAIAPPLERAMAVIDGRCVRSYTLAHEVGHLMGSTHEPGTHSGPVPFPYGHGHVDGAKAWRTVMATEQTCSAPCPRVALWSSPALVHPAAAGRAAGVAGVSEDLRVARERARVLATARCR